MAQEYGFTDKEKQNYYQPSKVYSSFGRDFTNDYIALHVYDLDDTLLAQSNDNDCDGVLTVDDCDDSDPNTVNDMDCDGVLTADDCDDSDASLLESLYDLDCDGTLNSEDCTDGLDNDGNVHHAKSEMTASCNTGAPLPRMLNLWIN